MRVRRIYPAALVAAVAIAGTFVAKAYEWPARPVTIIVPFGAGGPTDAVARIVAEGMRGPLGQPVVIENVAGASGTIGVGRVARAAPDGYTVSMGSFATNVLNGGIFTLQYDLINDFEPVALIAGEAVTIVARKTMLADDLKGLIAWLKANPDKATQGTSGPSGVGTVGGTFFQMETGTRFRFVPYRAGLAGAMRDLVAGQIDFMIDTAANSLPQWRAGTISAYAVASKKRLAAAPDIPTVDEAGLPSFYISVWYALFSPRHTPGDVIGKLNRAATMALADPNIQRRLVDSGYELFPPEQQTPEALGAFHKAEIDKWWPIIKAAHIKAD